jgi:hypothetical protein
MLFLAINFFESLMQLKNSQSHIKILSCRYYLWAVSGISVVLSSTSLECLESSVSEILEEKIVHSLHKTRKWMIRVENTTTGRLSFGELKITKE